MLCVYGRPDQQSKYMHFAPGRKYVYMVVNLWLFYFSLYSSAKSTFIFSTNIVIFILFYLSKLIICFISIFIIINHYIYNISIHGCRIIHNSTYLRDTILFMEGTEGRIVMEERGTGQWCIRTALALIMIWPAGHDVWEPEAPHQKYNVENSLLIIMSISSPVLYSPAIRMPEGAVARKRTCWRRRG